MSGKFKLVLLTSMVTTTQSLAPGEEIEVGNDEAWSLLHDGLAELKGKKKPTKPAHIAKAEAEAAAEEERQAEMTLSPIHPEGKELNAVVAKLAEREAQLKERDEYINELEVEVAKLEEAQEILQQQLAEATGGLDSDPGEGDA
ncbi:hypothetical protein [Microbulbifer discodermiae]|uniref:hypothetical protein n=1 Tax=Microbulbifer sp. 2201CG32-9 TaxID=3232309 RepID=UPI00345B5A8F